MRGLLRLLDRLGIQVLERAGLDPAAVDERVDFVLFEPDHAAEPVGRNVALVDCFWVIAASHLTESRGEADVQAIDGYWRRLIDANRDRLANPDDPDLLFANQELVLPPVDLG